MNQKELEEYIYAYGKDLYSFCCCVTRNQQEADDLYQDTFLKLYEMGEHLVIEKNPKGYLMAVSVNLYRNYKRKLLRRAKIMGFELSVEEDAVDLVSGNRMTEEEVIAREECCIIRQAVLKLPDKYRLPILLYYMEEMSMGEIAETLKLSPGAVKTRIHRAKKILKQKLEENHYEE